MHRLFLSSGPRACNSNYPALGSELRCELLVHYLCPKVLDVSERLAPNVAPGVSHGLRPGVESIDDKVQLRAT